MCKASEAMHIILNWFTMIWFLCGIVLLKIADVIVLVNKLIHSVATLLGTIIQPNVIQYNSSTKNISL